jgi:hypothetical protein
VGRQRPRGTDRLVGGPAHVGVDHQRDVAPEEGSHLAHALHVLGEARAADLHLDGAEAALAVLVGLAQQAIERELEVDAARVRAHAGIVTAQMLPERHAPTARRQVPERHVDGRDREHREPAPTHVVEPPPHPFPQRLDPHLVGAGQRRCQVPLDQRPDGRAAGADRVGVADPLGAILRVEPNRDQLEVRDVTVGRVGENGGQRYAVVVGANAIDGHRLPHLRHRPPGVDPEGMADLPPPQASSRPPPSDDLAAAGLECGEPFANVERDVKLALDTVDPRVEAPDLGEQLAFHRAHLGPERVHPGPEPLHLPLYSLELAPQCLDLAPQCLDLATQRVDLGRDDVLEDRLDLIVDAHAAH